MSDWDDSPAASPGLKLTVVAVLVLGIGALGSSWYTYQHQHSLVQAERDARVAEVATLRGQVNALRNRDASLNGQLQAVQTKQHDLAPLARRVLRSVFTVHTDVGLGSGFV